MVVKTKSLNSCLKEIVSMPYERTELSERLLEHIRKYVKYEDPKDPRCDAEIEVFVHKLGYTWVTMIDITRARMELNILSYQQRKWGGVYCFKGNERRL